MVKINWTFLSHPLRCIALDLSNSAVCHFAVNLPRVGWEALSEFPDECIAREDDDQAHPTSTDGEGEDYDYDYNGLPQNIEENPSLKAVLVSQSLEAEASLQYPAKCIGLTGHYI